MKFDTPKFAVVLPSHYDFAFIVEIDYETDKTFGKRGEQYHKDNCRWYICDDKEEAERMKSTLTPYTNTIEDLREKITDSLNDMYEQFDYYKKLRKNSEGE